MMICSLLLGILCAVPQVGAALLFDGDADAEIEDDVADNNDDDDHPRVLPRRRQQPRAVNPAINQINRRRRTKRSSRTTAI
jgi:hypothetical protein